MTEPSTRTQTLHLSPTEVWEGQRASTYYRPEAFAQDGFIHCTNEDARLVEVANMFYRSDPRPFVVLTLDLDRVAARWIYEDPDRAFPHIYGPLETSAVVVRRPVLREPDGTFVGFGEPESI